MSKILQADVGGLDDAAPQPLSPRQTFPSDASWEVLMRKRCYIRHWWAAAGADDPGLRDVGNAPLPNIVGLALSGGGIRSATLSLGAIQSLATTRDALSRIDILSTVSGGGYAGCFLRSLFMPDLGRGLDASPWSSSWTAEVGEQFGFADAVLTSNVKARDLLWPAGAKAVKRRNPLWWLREHSRYLAPNGATDFSYALAYLARNWLAMLATFAMATLACFITIVGLDAVHGAFCANAAQEGMPAWVTTPVCPSFLASMHGLFSPLYLLAFPPLAFAILACGAYWITQGMSPNEPLLSRQWISLGRSAGLTIVAGLALMFGSTWFKVPARSISSWRGPADATSLRDWLNWFLAHHPGVPLSNLGELGRGAWLGSGVWLTGIFLPLFAILALLAGALLRVHDRSAMTIRLRTNLTSYVSNANLIFLTVAGLATLDSLGAWIARNTSFASAHSGYVASLPVLAYLVKKVPDWFGRSSKIASAAWVERFLPAFAVILGLILYGAVAVIASAAVHMFAWHQWPQTGLYPVRFFIIAVTIFILTLLVGAGKGLINLSSLHSLYALRLTRAYFGATNTQRLVRAAKPGPDGNIKETDTKDYIQPKTYFDSDLPAPIHLINVTLNETVDPESQLVARDRKGIPLLLGPGGVRIGLDPRPIGWDALGGPVETAEQLSLGQWCAISGAALSSGMGRFTSLGFALTLTFANVRLGYWWWAPGVARSVGKQLSSPERAFSQLFGTFIHLWNEMTARYSRFYRRKYLTDGGHFENSGAYRLIERRVPLIIVCDNGADPDYRFGDLENLIRTARLDFGVELDLLRGTALNKFFKQIGVTDQAIFADPDKPDWRDQFRDSPHVLAAVLGFGEGKGEVRVIWIKPRVVHGVPSDVLAFASANKPFPQQSTGDQFFDEAQWESYRALGEFCMRKLLGSCTKLLA